MAFSTYLGGVAGEGIRDVEVDGLGNIYVGLQTRSKDIPTTPGAYDRTYNGGVDWYVAKLLPDGSGIVYRTYIGDEGDNWPAKNAFQNTRRGPGDAIATKLTLVTAR